MSTMRPSESTAGRSGCAAVLVNLVKYLVDRLGGCEHLCIMRVRVLACEIVHACTRARVHALCDQTGSAWVLQVCMPYP